ncbi:lymphokine-activated killer T-cell-originated protein kinase homolog [Onthophagus taurus]|uniref:lymphokine-activated killer T-cell-originated protein kinase homolog n=1 Tax=Onthophagus taurus TaxID=166361 RepID=UPI000C20C9A7|nr:lymphokine-activated killer T-cell-originated protein kinase homolog [Onthophagus taurus]
MDPLKTPVRNRLISSKVTIPASPLMKNLGYGTGVSVYELNRASPSNKTHSPWAIKKVSNHNRNKNVLMKRLCDEASVLKQLKHPNIVGFRAFTTDTSGITCLAMEACSASLGDLIETRYENGQPAFEPDCILKVAIDVADALNYLHNDAKIVHCDIKSYNILVKGDFEVCKLCDFGVTLPLNPDGTVDKKTFEDNNSPGTLPWMAPETLTNDIVSDKSDIYSYGIVIWEMLALVPPPLQEEDYSLLDDSEMSLDDSDCLNIRKIGSRPQLPPQEFGKEYNHVLELFHCCTEEDPSLRPKASDLVLIVKRMNECLKD